MLRDSEFCSIDHRTSYGKRLNQALRQMTAPQPAPAGMAGWMVQWPEQEGVCLAHWKHWQNRNDYPILLPGFMMGAALAGDDSAEQDRVPPLCNRWMPGLAAEPAAQFVAPSAAPDLTRSAAEVALQLPELLLSPALESAETAAEAFAEPPLCQIWMRAPEPDPVCSYVRPTVAGEATRRATGMAPVILGQHIVGDPQAPAISRWMAGAHGPALAASARSSQPSPVECWLPVAASTVRVIEGQTASGSPGLAMPELASGSLALCKPAPERAGPVTGALPMAVESPLVPSASAVPMASAPAVRMQTFILAAATESIAPGFEKPFLSPAPSAPKLPGNVVVLRPISTISVTPPPPQRHAPATAMPQPGIIPVEFHARRLRGTPVCEVQWQTPRIAPAPPRFVVRPVFDRLDQGLARQKPTPKHPAFAEVFTMKEAKKLSSPSRGPVFRAIAAALVIGAMWFGIGMARLSRQSTIARQDAFGGSSETAGPTASIAAASRPAREGAGRTQPKGPVAWVRQTIASRAAYQGADNFHNGMQAWGSAPKSYAAGWERNHEGYVHPGALAIFNPSRNFTDYRFEFFGQVEQKSMGWVVRAKDTNNYYAMKFKVLEAGLRPMMAVVHYSVVAGRTGRQVETPLSVMVHNNQPFQVAVDVKGNHFSASIDGEEVDSWSDDALPAGGVGFFAEAGERSRLYWMKISRNDDWLGRVCSMLDGSGAGPRATSELWGTGSGNRPPGGTPASRPVDSGDMTLAAAGLGLPFVPARRTRKSRNGRYQPWSS